MATELERLREAIWPGLPKWRPTPEQPQQDFYEGVCETLNAKVKLRDDWERVLALKFVAETDNNAEHGPKMLFKVHPNGSKQLATVEHLMEFIRSIRDDGTVGGIILMQEAAKNLDS